MIDLKDPVYREEIMDQQEVALDCWKVMYEAFQRAKAQGAPESLLKIMGIITTNFAENERLLTSIVECFPSDRM